MSSSIHGIVLKLVWEVLIDEGLDLIQDGSSITLADPNDVIICPGPGVLGSWGPGVLGREIPSDFDVSGDQCCGRCTAC